MTVVKEVNGEVANVKVEGRLDTTTAPQLDKELAEVMGESIMEIFEVTGFADILTIE